jgi:hypothetical protein
MAEYSQFCISYAMALRLLTGYPVYYLGDGHAIVKSPDGWLDEAGIRTLEEIAGDWGITTELYKLTALDYRLNAKFINGPDWIDVIAVATKQVEELELQ